MKYQIYLNKQVSTIVNALAKGCNTTPAKFLKEHLEQSFMNAYERACELLPQDAKKPISKAILKE